VGRVSNTIVVARPRQVVADNTDGVIWPGCLEGATDYGIGEAFLVWVCIVLVYLAREGRLSEPQSQLFFFLVKNYLLFYYYY
jgi:hypothetical protein